MPRLSKLLEKLEDRLADRWDRWYDRHKSKLCLYIPLALAGWYFYGMLLNSLKLGTASTFHTSREVVESIWVFNPLKNFFTLLYDAWQILVTAYFFRILLYFKKSSFIIVGTFDKVAARDLRGARLT